MVHGFQQSIESGGFLFGEKPGYVGLRNYKDVINDPVSRDAMRHTLEYVVLAVALGMVLGIFVAVSLHPGFRRRGLGGAGLVPPSGVRPVGSGAVLGGGFSPGQAPSERPASAA